MVSSKERKLLLGIASIALALFFAALSCELYRYGSTPQPESGGITFAVHEPRTFLAGFHLMTPIVFTSLFFARKFIVSTLLTSLYGLFLTANYFVRLNGEGFLGGEGIYDGRKLLEFYDKSHPFDLVACVFIFVVLIWQISILYRNFRDTSKLD